MQSIDHMTHLVEKDVQVRGTLLVKVVKALELPKLDVGGACDPFIEITVPVKFGKDDKKKKTKIIRRNQNPVFNQVLDFGTFEMHENDDTRGYLEVFDADQGTTPEFIGKAEFKLPTRNDSVEDYVTDIRLTDGKHRGVVVLQSLLIREDLNPSEKQRLRKNFANHLGDAVRKKRKKRR
jgi:Ca2+-dependent lipid-binding protein